LAQIRTDTRENPYLTWGIEIGPKGLPKLKTGAVRGVVEAEPMSFVWIDDDIDFLRDGGLTPREWTASIAVPSLLIAPDTRTGLLPRQLDAVDEFLRQHGGESTGGDTGGA
jgi:hypothetical protein